jgi:hypothetical protein
MPYLRLSKKLFLITKLFILNVPFVPNVLKIRTNDVLNHKSNLCLGKGFKGSLYFNHSGFNINRTR